LSAVAYTSTSNLRTDLLVTNGEFALGLLVGVGKGLELLDGLALRDLDAELDVTLGILVTGLEQIRQQSYGLEFGPLFLT